MECYFGEEIGKMNLVGIHWLNTDLLELCIPTFFDAIQVGARNCDICEFPFHQVVWSSKFDQALEIESALSPNNPSLKLMKKL